MKIKAPQDRHTPLSGTRFCLRPAEKPGGDLAVLRWLHLSITQVFCRYTTHPAACVRAVMMSGLSGRLVATYFTLSVMRNGTVMPDRLSPTIKH
ncbi:hypothetical protein RRG08_060992 [Elysia crispata]|uniref:Uncharacterized protein n=1 Tax=Elysia crispata TaxID=231223 RepID=A0AAE1AWV2_9GAST|nr:hypothetical protein RRG08_060992 [Elysia crispata]